MNYTQTSARAHARARTHTPPPPPTHTLLTSMSNTGQLEIVCLIDGPHIGADLSSALLDKHQPSGRHCGELEEWTTELLDTQVLHYQHRIEEDSHDKPLKYCLFLVHNSHVYV